MGDKWDGRDAESGEDTKDHEVGDEDGKNGGGSNQARGQLYTRKVRDVRTTRKICPKETI